ncbi:Serine/threonine protein kinase [Nannocystis exedens]|uniref:Serine/threonine protein kinase n=1 Tax=Nannocystis exedens TaxID=54 RepID=A0A1I2GT41_9BACT|nr:serine/threonine-protein kinase [Nannocystis exedens]PCC74076.1 protein kinase [Nannocystis exedens]SFF21094.1 Serine/threonine protein kinase [Nannocystis exedens]
MSGDDSVVSATGSPASNSDEVTADPAPGRSAAAGSLPARLGRYHVLGQLGAGGMGVVYTAYDPDLDRKVALKLLRAEGHAASPGRLLREAHALARLSHPNVVQIHDTGAIDGRIFIAMELVRGVDLRTWLAQPRSPAEVLRVFLDAGRGLAAAHEAGFVHRDFKPDNVLVGADGRARVADFGLVRQHDEPEGPAASEPDRGTLSRSLTMTGALLGTPAYMSPEQHRGGTADARSDQFSFCVALWEALHGQRPFAGDSPAAITAAMQAGQLRPARGAGVPGELTRILARGLAHDPERRYPNMQALLAALAVDRGQRRRRWLAGLGGAGLLAGLVAALTSGPEPCSGGPEALAGTWNPERRAAVGAALAGAGSDVSTRVLAGLDAYAGAWLDGHREACLDHRRGEQSSALLDARMGCLDRRRETLAAAARLLTGEPGIDAAQLVARLPPIPACAQPAVVLGEAQVPDDPSLAGPVAALGAELIEARVRLDAGDLDGALTRADQAVRRARAVGFEPLLAEALLAQVRVLFARSRWDAARPALVEALTRAVEARRDDLAAEAIARLLYVDGVQSGRTAEALRLAPLALAMAARAPEPHAARGLASNNIGVVQLLARDREGAAASIRRAVEELLAAPHADFIELTNAMFNVVMVTAGGEERHAALTRANELLAARLGPRHPVALDQRAMYARFEPELGQAVATLTEACPEFLAVAGGASTTCGTCFQHLAYLQMYRGDRAAALASAERVPACAPEADAAGQEAHQQARARAFVAVHTGRPEAALVEVARARTWTDGLREAAWIARAVAELELLRGRALLLLNRPDEAAEALGRAVSGLAGAGDRPDLLAPLWLAEAQALLARALLARTPPDPERAAALQETAAATFVAVGAVAP